MLREHLGTDEAADKAAVDDVIAKIDAIGKVKLDKDSKAKITAARAAYDALDDELKAQLAPFAGADIITLEGVSKNGRPDVVQQAFMDAGAVQCGFCIPGMILTAEAFLKKNPNPTRDEVKLAISGNLCRCTGYAKINDAVLLAAARMRGEEAEA